MSTSLIQQRMREAGITSIGHYSRLVSETAVPVPEIEAGQVRFDSSHIELLKIVCSVLQLAPELREIIYGWMAVATSSREEGITLEGYQDASDEAIKMLRYILFTAKVTGKKGRVLHLKLAKEMLPQATTAILKYLVITPAAISFPNALRNSPTGLPFHRHAGYLRHLELNVGIPITSAREVYPSQLYLMQKNIGLLDTWYKQLQSVTIVVTLQQHCLIDHPPKLRGSGFGGRPTTVVDEVTVLARKMSKLACKNVHLYVRNETKHKLTGALSTWQGKEVTEELVDRKWMRDVVKMLVEDDRWGEWRVDDRK